MKYQILAISQNDSLFNSGLIGKIGVGMPEIISGTSNNYSGRLLLPFYTKVSVFDSSKETNRISKKVIKTVLAEQCLYFSDVILKKIGN